MPHQRPQKNVASILRPRGRRRPGFLELYVRLSVFFSWRPFFQGLQEGEERNRLERNGGRLRKKGLLQTWPLVHPRYLLFALYIWSTASLKFLIPATGISRRPKLVSLFTTSNCPE